jgi:phosphoribosylamine--glycine ligase
LKEIKKNILQPTIEHMAELKRPYKGVLYAGVMITANGPKVLEYNCRFGDPETQVILPLLDSNLADIADASIAGGLGNSEIFWKPKSAVCVVLASENYAQNSDLDQKRLISGLDQIENGQDSNLQIFHASTKKLLGKYYSNGSGRVLGIAIVSDSRSESRNLAYSVIGNPIEFDGMQYRKDIAQD